MNFEQMTPEELEKPVNGYQMLAVVKELKGLNSTLSLVAKQTESVVTPAQLSKSEEDIKRYVDEEVKKIHLEYRPDFQERKRTKRTIIAVIITQVVVNISLWLQSKL